jgi:hypothetical protein
LTPIVKLRFTIENRALIATAKTMILTVPLGARARIARLRGIFLGGKAAKK